jgi:transcriptional regulator with XRE-family HTH domain
VNLNLHQEPPGKTSIQLTPYQGEQLRSLIIKATNEPFNRYLERMGLYPQNLSNYLSGRTRMSLDVLAKLLAGTNLRLECLLHITIKSGNGVEDVDSTNIEDTWFSTEPDLLVEETILIQEITPPNIP